MSWARDLRKLSVRPWGERGLLLEALLWLCVMRAAVWLLPFRRIAGLLGLAAGEEAPMPDRALVDAAARVGWALQAAAARTPWESTCLVQALAGSILLRRQGIPATLCLGVAKEAAATEGMVAHAWLRCGDAILVGANGAQRFTVISTFAVSRPSFPAPANG